MNIQMKSEPTFTLELTASELATLIAAYGGTSPNDREVNFNNEDDLVKQYNFNRSFSDTFYWDARKAFANT